MIGRLIFKLRGYRSGPGTRIGWRTLLHRPSGALSIGSENMIYCRFSFDRPDARISIGDRCFIGRSLIVAASEVEIEDDVLVSWGVTIVDHNSHPLAAELRKDEVREYAQGRKNWTHVEMGKVTLKKNCWIGFNAVILKGVTVGEGAVVGACSVVTRDVPPHSIVAGNPARVLRSTKDQPQEDLP